MYKICVFAGTTEGRELVEFLKKQPAEITACVATEYGETLLEPGENLTVSAARLTSEDMVSLFQKKRFDLVVDATHPYAQVVTENIMEACQQADTPYLRLLREQNAAPHDAVFVPNLAAAVTYLNTTQGNILLTTGSKELNAYRGIEGFSRRVYVRVLPMEDSLRLCQSAGVAPSHILAMQGPFSSEMNIAMLHAADARYMVTKESGKAGGFDEKIQAARTAGAKLVIIGRPSQKTGLSFHETVKTLGEKFGFRQKPSVSIVGIGPGCKGTMTEEVRNSIRNAECIIGAKRMLEAVREGTGALYDAIAPEKIANYIWENPRYQRFTVVMSGDVGFYSGAKKLLPLLSGCDVSILPGISSLVYLCSRLGTSYEDVYPVSLHGRTHNILSDLRRHPRVFVLVGGENGIGKLCQALVHAKLGNARVRVGQRLSYPDEEIITGTAASLAGREFHSLCVALIETERTGCVLTHGLPDEVFLRGSGAEGVVPMTKQEIRSICLSKLQLTDSSICWDVGAGTGSVSIEMALQANSGHVYAIEKKEAALTLLRENCEKFHTDHVTVVSGAAPEACIDLPAPTHAFIGGSSGNMKDIIRLLLEKNPDVRIVATAIALESVGELTSCMKEFSFSQAEVVCVNVARGRKAGPYHLMNGQNPIYIFTMQSGGISQ